MPITVLDSGLTVVSDPMPHVETVAAGVWVDAGTRSEGPSEHGMAHFLEHMAFKGTASRSGRAIAEAIEAVGGEINAATSVDNTAYHARMLADDLPLALDVLADILTAPVFDPADVRLEANVILQEIGAAEDVPEDRAFDAFPQAAFRAQPLGRPILGSRRSVAAVDSAALRRFFEAHYAAGRMTVAVAGKVDHDALVAHVERAFAAAPRHVPPAPERASYTGGAHTDSADAVECQLLLGFEGRRALRADAVAAHVAAMVLGGGTSSRLFQSLREERGLCYDTSAFHWAFQDCGLFGIHVAAAPEEMGAAIPLALDEIENTLDRVDEEETDRAKAQLKAGLLMSRESCASRAGQAARQAMLWGRLIPAAERVAQIEAVSADDVRTILGEMVRTTPTIVGVGRIEPPTAEALASRFGTATGGAA